MPPQGGVETGRAVAPPAQAAEPGRWANSHCIHAESARQTLFTVSLRNAPLPAGPDRLHDVLRELARAPWGSAPLRIHPAGHWTTPTPPQRRSEHRADPAPATKESTAPPGPPPCQHEAPPPAPTHHAVTPGAPHAEAKRTLEPPGPQPSLSPEPPRGTEPAPAHHTAGAPLACAHASSAPQREVPIGRPEGQARHRPPSLAEASPERAPRLEPLVLPTQRTAPTGELKPVITAPVLTHLPPIRSGGAAQALTPAGTRRAAARLSADAPIGRRTVHRADGRAWLAPTAPPPPTSAAVPAAAPPPVPGNVAAPSPGDFQVLHREQVRWSPNPDAATPRIQTLTLTVLRQPSRKLTTLVLQPHFAAEVRLVKPWSLRKLRSRVDRLRKRYAVQGVLAGGELRGELMSSD